MLLKAKDKSSLSEAKHSRAVSCQELRHRVPRPRSEEQVSDKLLGRKETAVFPQLTKREPLIQSENHSNLCINPEWRGIWDRMPTKASPGTLLFFGANALLQVYSTHMQGSPHCPQGEPHGGEENGKELDCFASLVARI